MKGRGKDVIIGIMGRRYVTPRWADDTEQRQDGHWWMGCQGRRGMPPPEGNQTTVRVGEVGQE